MRSCRVHITGASGAGVTTLGRALSDHLAVPHHDTDDYYWAVTDPPYASKREVADRLRLMAEMFLGRPAWVLSGSLDGWGDPLIPLFDLTVFVRTPAQLRLRRLRDREARRYGADAMMSSGARHQDSEAFITWASRYDDGDLTIRSLARHEAWLHTLRHHCLRVDGARPVDALVREIVGAIGGGDALGAS
jgi:adenylate kinase family enzyme